MKIDEIRRMGGCLAPFVFAMVFCLATACGGPSQEPEETPEAPAAEAQDQADAPAAPSPAVEEAAPMDKAPEANLNLTMPQPEGDTPEERRANLLEKYDTNKNGTLDPDEKEALAQARRAQWKQLRDALVEQYDKNGNGVLDPDEKLAMQTDRAKARRGQ